MTDELVPPRKPGFETLAIHAGQDPDPTAGAVTVPIYYKVAERLARELPGGYLPNQYENPMNPDAHYRPSRAGGRSSTRRAPRGSTSRPGK